MYMKFYFNMGISVNISVYMPLLSRSECGFTLCVECSHLVMRGRVENTVSELSE